MRQGGARNRKRRTPPRFGRGDLGGVRAFGATGRQPSNAADQWWFPRQREKRPRNPRGWEDCFRGHTAVAPAQHSAFFCLNQKVAPEFSLRRGRHSPLLMALGELHGRNRASAFMRGRVHNRTSDRGGKPIRLAWSGHCPRSFRRDRGRSYGTDVANRAGKRRPMLDS
jgi:hypothetical protein